MRYFPQSLYSYFKITFFSFIICVFFSCEKEGGHSDIPSISFVSITNSTFINGEDEDSTDNIQITIKYVDGDGDLGGDTLFYINGIITNNNKDSSVIYRGLEAGFSGITFNDVFNSGESSTEGTIIYTDKIAGTGFRVLDTVVFEIYLQDRAGNKSNIIRTDPEIILRGTPGG